MSKLLLMLGTMLFATFVSNSQGYIGIGKNQISAYFPNSDIKEIVMRDTVAYIILDKDYRTVLWYNSLQERVTGYSICPTSPILVLHLENGLNENCTIINPEKEWLCKKDFEMVKVTKAQQEGKDHIIVDILNYVLVR